MRTFSAALRGLLLFGLLAGVLPRAAFPDDAPPPARDAEPPQIVGVSPALAAEEDLRALVDRARRSVVVVTFAGRDGARQGLGSGFIVAADGLIATNLHVLGEARPISVQLFDGRTFDVTEIHATEKSQDLAVIRIPARDLPALPLAAADSVQEGDPLVAIGNPQGLAHSVVTGVSGVRKDVDGLDLIQLAMPIERGNSGGPVINLRGEVVGLVTLKSLVEENVGFAVVADQLRPLLEKPNPIAMSKWLTIGVINPRLWEVLDDTARWTQRAGRIRATGKGTGFGGRSLCLSRVDRPDSPYECGVLVKMDETDGAAGLVFLADGANRHYGFYPSSGKLRLTRFEGPTVYQWNVLRDEPSPHYREGDWNYLKVRVTPDTFQCFCNDELIYEEPVDNGYRVQGRVGLAKFRHTTAEFREFRIENELPSLRPDAALAASIHDQVREIPVDRPPTPAMVAALIDRGAGTTTVLEERARLLERQAERLRQLAAGVHERQVRERLVEVLAPKEGPVDVLHAALLLAALDNPELNIEQYQEQVDAMSKEWLASLPAGISEDDKLQAFHRYLFEEQGFHGSRTNYYAASNSYLNEVLDDREGLPITLSVLYIELARRCGMNVVGIGLPGHFIVQYRPAEGEPKLIDPFDRGRELSQLEATVVVKSITGLEWDDRYLEPQGPHAIILRILRNLINVANTDDNPEAALRYLDTVLALDPNSPADRLYKAVLCLNTGRADEGLAEVDWVLEHQPEGLPIEQVYRLREALKSLPSATP